MLDPSLSARLLADARRSSAQLDRHPGTAPATRAGATALQREVSQALGWTQRGYKVGCTSLKAQQALKTDRPFWAPLFAERTFASGAHVPTGANALRIVEPEIAFVMGAALPRRATPYTCSDVLAAVESVHPALEIVSPRLPNGLANPIEWIIADGGVSDAFVLGPGVAPLAAAAYAEIAVEARIGESIVGRGVGANALGGAEQVLVWLADQLCEDGEGLAAGDIVTTGLLTEIFRAEPGDEVLADFAAVGCVRARF